MQSLVKTMTSTKQDQAIPFFTLAQAYHNTYGTEESETSVASVRRASAARITYWVSPEDIPHMDLMSPSLRRHIVDGKDVNLANFLIPNYEVPENNNLPKNDRMRRSLSTGEFVTAFGRYKRTMCQAFPDRRDELDRYDAIVVVI